MISKESAATRKPAGRKARTKIRKRKFLSLRLQLIPSENTPQMPPNTGGGDDDDDDEISHEQKKQQQLINLFPLHPENQEKQMEEEQNMACIFSSCDDDQAATTLTGILCSDDDEDDDDDVDEEEGGNLNKPSPSSVNYAEEERKLVRTAMRRRNYKTERDHHEKWVSYSEVVERKEVEVVSGLLCSHSPLATSSSSCSNHMKIKLEDDHHHQKKKKVEKKLVLKLDYEEIINTWVDKGPLYIHDNPDPDLGLRNLLPQTVPDLQLHDDDFFLPSTPLGGQGQGHENSSNGGGGVWTVPELVANNSDDVGKMKEESGGGGGGEVESKTTTRMMMMGQREASVQRYKEKRQNRLFSKTIRYQVRKLNAEKRPRVKGRFVKST